MILSIKAEFSNGNIHWLISAKTWLDYNWSIFAWQLLHLKLLFSVPNLLHFIALTQFLALYPNTKADNRKRQTHNWQLDFSLKEDAKR